MYSSTVSIVLEVSTLSLFIIFIFLAARRGLVRTAMEFAGFLISSLGAAWLSSPIADFFYKSFVRQIFVGKIKLILQRNTAAHMDKTFDNVFREVPKFVSYAAQKLNITYASCETGLKDAAEKGAETAAPLITDIIIGPVMILLIRVIATLILFTLFMIAMTLIIKAIDSIFDLPVLSGINTFFGGVLGALKAIAIVLIVCAAIRLWAPLTKTNEVFRQRDINATILFGTMYNHNPIYDIIRPAELVDSN